MNDFAVNEHKIKNQLKKAENVFYKSRNRGLTNDTRFTIEGVIDSRTKSILEKLFKKGYFDKFGLTISTGKEANVYGLEATQKLNQKFIVVARAAKIFKTSILVFKNRRQYVEGEHRFKIGYGSSSNPRKMIKQWAEKEFRNMKRLFLAGIRSPLPIELRGNIIVMTLIGKDSETPAPRLKDYHNENLIEWKRLYVETILLLREFYQKCKLVHGDFSEYNLLYFSGHPYIIDVSQSTENSNLNSDRLLKRDCLNITNFFKRKISCSEFEEEKSDESIDYGDFEYNDEHKNTILSKTLGIDKSVSINDDDYDVKSIKSQLSVLNDEESTKSLDYSGTITEDFEFDDEFEYDEHYEAKRIFYNTKKLKNIVESRMKHDPILVDPNSPWNQFAKSDCVLVSKLSEVTCLSIQKLYEYVKTENLSDFSSISLSDLKWPVFDENERIKELENYINGKRLSNVINHKSIVKVDDCSRYNERELSESNNNEDNLKNLNLNEILKKHEEFNQLTLITLNYILETNSRISDVLKNNSVDFFLNTYLPSSLHEMTILDAERNAISEDLNKFSQYLSYESKINIDEATSKEKSNNNNRDVYSTEDLSNEADLFRASNFQLLSRDQQKLENKKRKKLLKIENRLKRQAKALKKLK